MNVAAVEQASLFKRIDPKFIGFITLVLGATAVGIGPIFIRVCETAPVASAFWRVSLGLPLLFLMSSVKQKTETCRVNPSSRDYLWLIISGIFFAIDLVFWNTALVYTTVANASLLANCTPVVVVIVSWVVFRQRPTSNFMIALSITLLGAFCLVAEDFKLSKEHLIGDLFGILTAFFYGLYMVGLNRFRQKFSTLKIMTITTAASTMALLLLTYSSGQSFEIGSMSGFLAILGLAFITQVMGQGLIAYGFAFLPATISSLTMLVAPVVATLCAWWLFEEALSTLQAIGIIIVLFGISLAKRQR